MYYQGLLHIKRERRGSLFLSNRHYWYEIFFLFFFYFPHFLHSNLPPWEREKTITTLLIPALCLSLCDFYYTPNEADCLIWRQGKSPVSPERQVASFYWRGTKIGRTRRKLLARFRPLPLPFTAFCCELSKLDCAAWHGLFRTDLMRKINMPI